jgi:hypothetical protein
MESREGGRGGVRAKFKEERAEQRRGEQNRGRGEAEEKRVEVMMWQRQKGLRKFCHKGPNMQVFP